jgi:hypothetical protein
MEPWQERDYRRQLLVERAVGSADRIIMEGADGSTEELNYLTAQVAEAFMKKALMPLATAMLKRDLLADDL